VFELCVSVPKPTSKNPEIKKQAGHTLVGNRSIDVGNKVVPNKRARTEKKQDKDEEWWETAILKNVNKKDETLHRDN